MKKIVVVGSTGMLGSVVTRYFETLDMDIHEVNRKGISVVKKNENSLLDLESAYNLSEIIPTKSVNVVINCAGLIRQLINPNQAFDVERAYKVNAIFPEKLNAWSERNGIPVIQIGTDCVYSGTDGTYNEKNVFDPSDIYGQTKAMGENKSPSAMTLRSSIVGLERSTSNSLMSWLRSQPMNSKIKGYTNHYWNGITTLAFAKVVAGAIANENIHAGTFHLVPANQVSKYELLQYFIEEFERTDIELSCFENPMGLDRTLSTLFKGENEKFWLDGGYNNVPTIKEMVEEYVNWENSLKSN